MVNSFGARATLCTGSLLVSLGSLLLATWASRGWHFVAGYGFLLGAGCSTLVSKGAEMEPPRPAPARTRARAMARLFSNQSVAHDCAATMDPNEGAAHGNWRAGWFCLSAAGLVGEVVSILFVKNCPEEVGQVADGNARLVREISGDAAPQRSRIYRTRNHWTVREAVHTPAFWLLTLASISESGPPHFHRSFPHNCRSALPLLQLLLFW
jgi:hypothetical protein